MYKSPLSTSCGVFDYYNVNFLACTCCTLGGLDLIFVLDVSISIKSDRFQLIRDFVAKISGRLDVGPEHNLAGVISFGDNALIHFDLQDNLNKTDLLSAIAKIPYLRLKGTNTHTACIESSPRGSTRCDADIDELGLIASDPSLAFSIENFDLTAIEELEQRISNQLCNRSSCPLTNCTKRSKCEIDEQTGEAYCRRSCDIENGGCEHRLCITEERSYCQIKGIDLVFVLDASGSVTTNFNLIKRFAEEVVLRLNFSRGLD
ncbi:cartilage matrix protein-like [Dysidea avara]|uniref:cartilage matrix protein-like n=1 Tax=Dysidea avara TaxID=196820 RepID=UPI00332C169C